MFSIQDKFDRLHTALSFKIRCSRMVLGPDEFLFPTTNWERRNWEELVKRQMASKSTFCFKSQALVKAKHINDALAPLIRIF